MLAGERATEATQRNQHYLLRPQRTRMLMWLRANVDACALQVHVNF